MTDLDPELYTVIRAEMERTDIPNRDRFVNVTRMVQDALDAQAAQSLAGLAGKPAMISCRSCVHFAPDSSLGYSAPFGSCELAPATADKSNDASAAAYADPNAAWPDWTDGEWMLTAHPGVLAYTSDASSYSSVLHVHPDFGCVAHVAAEEQAVTDDDKAAARKTARKASREVYAAVLAESDGDDDTDAFAAATAAWDAAYDAAIKLKIQALLR